MRERIEDLGRLSVLLNNIIDMEIFELYHGRDKDFSEFFRELDVEKREDLLDSLIYGLSDIRQKLFDCISIAEGCDSLNEWLGEKGDK